MISERLPCAGEGDTLSAVSEREHPAAKAGRFVRAAGRAGRAAAREYERQSAARPAPVTAALLPPPPPPLRTGGLVGRTVFVGFVVALALLVLAALRVETLVFAHGARAIFRLVSAGILFAEGALLTSNWRGSNERLGQRLLNRVWGPRAAVTRREKAFARLVRDGLTVLGIVFLAAAVFELLSAALSH